MWQMHLHEGELHHAPPGGQHAHPTVHQQRCTHPGLLPHGAEQDLEGVEGPGRRQARPLAESLARELYLRARRGSGSGNRGPIRCYDNSLVLVERGNMLTKCIRYSEMCILGHPQVWGGAVSGRFDTGCLPEKESHSSAVVGSSMVETMCSKAPGFGH